MIKKNPNDINSNITEKVRENYTGEKNIKINTGRK